MTVEPEHLPVGACNFTSYPLHDTPQSDVRCRNAYTLIPLFTLRIDNVLQTSAQPIASVPAEYFWQNSHGYGFDIRNLSVLLRVNFRNLNPHDLREHIWCNAADLASLLHHPKLDARILINIKSRHATLTRFSDDTKRKLADTAQELYSFSLQGFYNWVNANYDSTIAGLTTRSKYALLTEIYDTQLRKCNNATQAIRQHSSSQAAEHQAEPAEISRSSELYDLLEVYKASVAESMLDYLKIVKSRQAKRVSQLNVDVQTYIQTKFNTVLQRYLTKVQRVKKTPGHSLLLIHVTIRHSQKVTRPVPQQRYRMSGAFRTQTHGVTTIVYNLHHIRISYVYGHSDPLQVLVDDVALSFRTTDNVLLYLQDTLPQWKGSSIELASLAGGLLAYYKGPAWTKTINRDNNFLHSMITILLLPASIGSLVTTLFQSKHLELHNNMQRSTAVMDVLGGPLHDNNLSDMLYAFVFDVPTTFEHVALDQWIIEGGYDQYRGNLSAKLQTALNRQTCIQDVAAELCEFLSLPYPPELAHVFQRFQCDHTNVPLMIRAAQACTPPGSPPPPSQTSLLQTSPLQTSSSLTSPPPLLPTPIEIDLSDLSQRYEESLELDLDEREENTGNSTLSFNIRQDLRRQLQQFMARHDILNDRQQDDVPRAAPYVILDPDNVLDESDDDTLPLNMQTDDIDIFMLGFIQMFEQ